MLNEILMVAASCGAADILIVVLLMRYSNVQ